VKNVYHRLLLVIAGATQQELATYVRYLKTENQTLRSKLPRRVPVTEKEKAKLMKFGSQIGGALNELVTIVHPNSLRRWIREPTKDEVRELIVKLGRENAWGYTRILGELGKLGIQAVSRNTVKNILKENGLDPGPQRGAGTCD
jgi:putative transposase